MSTYYCKDGDDLRRLIEGDDVAWSELYIDWESTLSRYATKRWPRGNSVNLVIEAMSRTRLAIAKWNPGVDKDKNGKPTHDQLGPRYVKFVIDGIARRELNPELRGRKIDAEAELWNWLESCDANRATDDIIDDLIRFATPSLDDGQMQILRMVIRAGRPVNEAPLESPVKKNKTLQIDSAQLKDRCKILRMDSAQLKERWDSAVKQVVVGISPTRPMFHKGAPFSSLDHPFQHKGESAGDGATLAETVPDRAARGELHEAPLRELVLEMELALGDATDEEHICSMVRAMAEDGTLLPKAVELLLSVAEPSLSSDQAECMKRRWLLEQSFLQIGRERNPDFANQANISKSEEKTITTWASNLHQAALRRIRKGIQSLLQ